WCACRAPRAAPPKIAGRRRSARHRGTPAKSRKSSVPRTGSYDPDRAADSRGQAAFEYRTCRIPSAKGPCLANYGDDPTGRQGRARTVGVRLRVWAVNRLQAAGRAEQAGAGEGGEGQQAHERGEPDAGGGEGAGGGPAGGRQGLGEGGDPGRGVGTGGGGGGCPGGGAPQGGGGRGGGAGGAHGGGAR